MEFRKMAMTTLYARQEKRHRCVYQTFGLRGRGRGWDDLRIFLKNLSLSSSNSPSLLGLSPLEEMMRGCLLPDWTCFSQSSAGITQNPVACKGTINLLLLQLSSIYPILFFFFDFFYWSVVDLQCCVNFCCIYIYIYIHMCRKWIYYLHEWRKWKKMNSFLYSFPLWFIWKY